MLNDFRPFGKAIATKYDSLIASKVGVLLTSAIEPDKLWELYLGSFPEGTNPVFKERTEHDCNCCRNFIRNLGNTILVHGGKNKTIWDDHKELPYPYSVVAKALSDAIHTAGIKTIFRREQASYGAEKTRDLANLITWNHFHGSVPSNLVTKSASETGAAKTNADLFKRGLETIRPDAIATVESLITDDAIYRGTEHLPAVSEFKKLQAAYSKLNSAEAKEIFIWENLFNRAALFRNTLIGTLVTEISEGVDLEKAVTDFEKRTAPENYKRPKALVTKKMIEDAMVTIEKLGVADSLERRGAVMTDISVNDVLWANRVSKGSMKGGVMGLLAEVAETVSGPGPTEMKNPVSIPIADFVKNIIPTADKIAIGGVSPANLMTLTTAVHDDAPGLFKWDNHFAWSYNGNITDSTISARVAEAGGRVAGAKLRFSLAWKNSDDLDIHVRQPKGPEVYFGNRQDILDVDMNAFSITPKPVENCSWMKTPADGVYEIFVDNYNNRNHGRDDGFQVEIESGGRNYVLTSTTNTTTRTKHTIRVTVTKGVVSDVKFSPKYFTCEGLGGVEVWGIDTYNWTEIDTLMLSPNAWGEGPVIGNLHHFFVVAGALPEGRVRGVYNEYLKFSLGVKHRRVFEMLGSKTEFDPVPGQLTGFGFSSTVRNAVPIKVTTGKRVTYYTVNF